MTNIYVGNLLYATTDADLVEFFSQWGDVECATLIFDRGTGRPRGFAFVGMPDAGEAAHAVSNAHGAELNGRPLTVNEARPRGSAGSAPPHAILRAHQASHASPQHQDVQGGGNRSAAVANNPAPPAEYLPKERDPSYATDQPNEPVRRSGGYTNHLYE